MLFSRGCQDPGSPLPAAGNAAPSALTRSPFHAAAAPARLTESCLSAGSLVLVFHLGRKGCLYVRQFFLLSQQFYIFHYLDVSVGLE